MRSLLSELRLYSCNHVITHLPSHALRRLFYAKIMRFKLSSTASVFMGTRFENPSCFSMGDSSVVNARCKLDNRGGIEIGRCVAISEECCLLTAGHDPRSPSFTGDLIAPIIIEDYVWIGTRALILPGIRLGQGCVVGAGSVVTQSVAPFTIVAGNPARKIGERPRVLDYDPYYRRWFH